MPGLAVSEKARLHVEPGPLAPAGDFLTQPWQLAQLSAFQEF